MFTSLMQFVLSFFNFGKKDSVKPTEVSPVRFHNILFSQKKRGRDAFGVGDYGASRDGGSRSHDGIDYVAQAGDAIFAPFSGEITRTMQVYKDDSRYRGIEIKSTNSTHVAKIFYVSVHGNIPRAVRSGEMIGFAQNLAPKYAGITNHVHFELRVNHILQNPEGFFL